MPKFVKAGAEERFCGCRLRGGAGLADSREGAKALRGTREDNYI